MEKPLNAFDFANIFVRDIRVAALAPTSRYAIGRMLPYIPIGAKTIAEYGPGDGVITKHLLKRLPASGKIVAIERNADFIRKLENIRDPRLYVKQDDGLLIAEHLRQAGIDKVDAVISGIPFSFFAPSERERIVEQTHAALSPNGIFIVYQFSLLMLSYLKRWFTNVEWYLEIRNLPPLCIMVARKGVLN